MNVDRLAPGDAFESLLRDYEVRYVVSLVAKNGLREFEFQMEQSRRFRFEVAYCVGDVEVLRVSRRAEWEFKQGEAVELSPRIALASAKHERAEAMFVRVSGSRGADVTGAFYAAVAESSP